LLTAIWVGICGTFLQLGQDKEIAKLTLSPFLTSRPKQQTRKLKGPIESSR